LVKIEEELEASAKETSERLPLLVIVRSDPNERRRASSLAAYSNVGQWKHPHLLSKREIIGSPKDSGGR